MPVVSQSVIAPGEEPPGVVRVIALWWGERPLSQFVLFAGVLAIFGYLGDNIVDNMHRVGIGLGFGFLGRPANFEIGESVIPFSSQDSYGRAILVGLLNTVKVSAWGCLLATLLGVALGVARLSSNKLLSGTVQGYVELLRNTPLLLQLFFWNALVHALPAPRQALEPLPHVFLTNRGLIFPVLSAETSRQWLIPAVFVLVLVGAGAALLLGGQDRRISTAKLACIIGLPLLVLIGLASPPGWHPTIELPHLRGFNIVDGGMISPEFVALLVGLVVNAAAGISEIVRSGIEAIPKGQWEAARALGLHSPLVLRLVVLPQALRIIIPLMTSSYLSLTKNSSLAVAIGFPDLVSVINTSANQTGQALETILIMVGVYLVLSLAVSAAMNYYNARRLGRDRRRA